MNIIEHIEKTNKEFEEATPERKRVMVAQDVILRLDLNLIKANTGTIIQDLGEMISDNEYEEEDSAKDFVNRESCTVCMKGSLLCALVGRVNEFSLGQMRKFSNYDIEESKVNDEVHPKLAQLFSFEQLDLVETAFEGKSYMKLNNDFDAIDNAIAFYKQNHESINKWYDEETQDNMDNRLRLICNNIITNNGTFIP